MNRSYYALLVSQTSANLGFALYTIAVQIAADERTLTKILAAKSTLIFIFSIVGIGALTDLIGVRLVYILSGGLLIFSSLFGFVHLQLQRKGNV